MRSTASNRDISGSLSQRLFHFAQRRTTVFLLGFCVVGLTATFLGTRGGESPVQENQVVRFVDDQYGLLAQGKYSVLSENVVEGLWTGEAKNFVLSGLVLRSDAEEQLEEDLGVGGWRLHFVTLKAVKYVKVSRDAFRGIMKRESEILDSIDPSKEVRSVSVVTMAGHNTGRCSIVEWERQVPVIERRGKYTILMRGAPKVYELVHNEQWFQPVRF